MANRNIQPSNTTYPEQVKPTQYYTSSDGSSSFGDGSLNITLSVLTAAVGMVALAMLVMFAVMYGYRKWKQVRAGAVSTALELSDASGLLNRQTHVLRNEMYSDQDRECYGLEELKWKVDMKSSETYKTIKFEENLESL